MVSRPSISIFSKLTLLVVLLADSQWLDCCASTSLNLLTHLNASSPGAEAEKHLDNLGGNAKILGELPNVYDLSEKHLRFGYNALIQVQNKRIFDAYLLPTIKVCTGSLITKKHVLTSASCCALDPDLSVHKIGVTTSARFLYETTRTFGTRGRPRKKDEGYSEVIFQTTNLFKVPPEYRDYRDKNSDDRFLWDICIITLMEDVELRSTMAVLKKNIQGDNGQNFPTGTHMQTFGWGSQTDQLTYPDSLRGMNTTLVSCDETPLQGDWGDQSGQTVIPHPKFFCAHASIEAKEGGPCAGDEGGPLIRPVAQSHATRADDAGDTFNKLVDVVGVFVYKSYWGNLENCMPPDGTKVLIGYVNTMAKPIRKFIEDAVKPYKTKKE